MKDSRRGFIGRVAGWLGMAAAAPAGDYLAAPPALAPPITQSAPVPAFEGMPLMPGTYCFSTFTGRPLEFSHSRPSCLRCGHTHVTVCVCGCQDARPVHGAGDMDRPAPRPDFRRGGFGGLHLHAGDDREGFF